ncbi:MAG: hypothetical protein ACXABY_19200 [Candidatus Thorarchaeota archaeon]|jgi:hypothetical protein
MWINPGPECPHCGILQHRLHGCMNVDCSGNWLSEGAQVPRPAECVDLRTSPSMPEGSLVLVGNRAELLEVPDGTVILRGCSFGK